MPCTLFSEMPVADTLRGPAPLEAGGPVHPSIRLPLTCLLNPRLGCLPKRQTLREARPLPPKF